MKKLNLENKETIVRLLDGETLYFAEESCLYRRLWPEGRAEAVIELEKELIGLPAIVRKWEFTNSTRPDEEDSGFYRGLEQMRNGARSSGDPVTPYSIVHYWHEVTYGLGHFDEFRCGLVLPGDAPDELTDALKAALPGYDFTYSGRSGFAARNRWIISGCPSEMHQVLVLSVRAMDSDEAEQVGLPLHTAESVDKILEQIRGCGEALNWFAITATIEEMEIFDTSELDSTHARIVAERRKAKQLELVGENPPAQLSVEIGGTTGFTEDHLPDGYTKLFNVVTGYYQDSRQNRTHRQRFWLADVDRLKKEGCRQIKLDIPSEYKGKFIGKGGRRIKELEAKIGLRIKLL